MVSNTEFENVESFSHVKNDENNFNNRLYDKNVLPSQSNVSLSTQQKLELSSWELPDKVLQFYKNKGITRMFQWQLECLTLGRVLDAGNLVYSAPTSAGKTLVAEILIAKSVFELQKKVLIILPFVSVVREKMFYFKSMYASSGINVEGYMGGHSPSVCFKQVHIAVCTIEKANSIINRLLEEQSLQKLGLVVVDEIHLLGDPYRGYLLELLLTKLKYISVKSNFKIQIVGMSATLPNLKSLADWLNADLYYTDFRPVPLKEKLKCGNEIFDKKLNKLSDLIPLSSEAVDDSENVSQLCLETIANGHSVLIFCPTKIWCENLAEKISMFFRQNGCSKSAEIEGTPGWILRNQLDLKKINDVIEHLKMSPVGLDKDLAKTVSYGVAFHHAGLTLDERDIIEGSFRKGSIRVLCATSTLSSGVNLPARRVIIRSPMSFGGLMDILTYHQMIGRAGRMGVDSEGESILICKPNEKALCQTLMCSKLKPIESCLGHGRLSASLKRALLEIVASGVAANPEEVKKYASCTFLACSSKYNIEDPIQSCIEFLEENEFIRLQENGSRYVPTPLAKACLASSLPPDEGLALFRELQRARRCFVLDTDLHIIYQVTPYSVSEQWSKVDWLNVLNILEGLSASMKRVGEMVGVEESFLVRIVKGVINPNAPENRNKLSIHRRFYTSLALQDLVNEIPLVTVAEKYQCNKGMLQSLQQSAATYAGMVTEFTKRLGWGSVELIFSQFQERLQFGIQRELCELMRLPLLNAIRARALFKAGFTNISSIANASVSDLENAFFGVAPFQSEKEIDGETKYDKDQRNKMQSLWITGKADLSIRQAAELLIEESRKILEIELGLEGVQWGKKSSVALNKIDNESINYSVSQNLNATKINFKETNDFENSNHKSQNLPTAEEQLKVEVVKEPRDVNKSNLTKNICDKNNIDLSANVISKSSLEKEINVINKINVNITETSKLDEISNKLNLLESNDLDVKKLNSKQMIKVNATIEPDNILSGEKCAFIKKNVGDEIDYFASSFNFDVIPDYNVSEKCSAECIVPEGVTDEVKVITASFESDSNSSIEILYDSNILNSSKNLSFSRISEDLFEISKKENENKKLMSTPIVHKSNTKIPESEVSQCDTRSPDLFSQSLTFDTQIGRVLDFEEGPVENVPQIINPSSSFNSDDLGFVSDLSPPKAKLMQVQNVQKINAIEEKRNDNCLKSERANVSFIEAEFKTPVVEKQNESKNTTVKRAAADSPDLISDFDEVGSQHTSKRIKFSVSGDEQLVSTPKASKENDSDDEIMPTPKLDKTCLSNKLHNDSVRTIHRSILNKISQRSGIYQTNITSTSTKSSEEKKTFSDSSNHRTSVIKATNSCKSDEVSWDKITIIDVCDTEEKFSFFCEQLKSENIVGLALGCRRKTEGRKSIIGMKVVKKKKVEEINDKVSKCRYGDIILDGVAFYWKGNEVFYMSFDDGNVQFEDKLDLLKSLCLKEKTFRIFDTKEQIKMLQRCCSVLLTSSYQDPKIGFWLLSEKWKEKNFPSLVLEYIPCSGNIVSLIEPVVGNSSPGLFAKSIVSHKTRASVEAFLTYHVISKQVPLLRGKGLLKIFEEAEMPIVLPLAEMELYGFQISREELLKVTSKLDSTREILEKEAFHIADHKFSISSSAAVSKVLFKQLCLDKDAVALTKKRKVPSTSKQALQELFDETKHPLPKIILQWRKVRSISSKFVSPLLQISSESTKVFGVSQTFTVTGRISFFEPNLQNIPKNFVLECEKNQSIEISLRDVFIATKNCILLAVDYCQIELRLLAHLSQDLKLIKDIREASDIFVSIAATTYGIPHYEVDYNLRQKAKQTFYGMVYGIGPQNLSLQLNIKESDALELIEDFKKKYPGVTNYLERIVSECKKKNYVVTLLGRRRYLSGINDSNQFVRMEAERQAINTTIQGSAADLVKTAMIKWREKMVELRDDGVTGQLVLHLHDELIFEVGKDKSEIFALHLKDTLEHAMNLAVPFPVKIKTGPSWGQLVEYKFQGM